MLFRSAEAAASLLPLLFHRAAARHQLLFHRTTMGSVPHLALTPLMRALLLEERRIHDELLPARLLAVRKLLMLTAHRRVSLAKLHHCRSVLGLPDDFRDRVRDFPDDFRVAVDPDGLHVLELAPTPGSVTRSSATIIPSRRPVTSNSATGTSAGGRLAPSCPRRSGSRASC